MITGKSLPRRSFLRGMGTAVALPFLDAMVPAFACTRPTSSTRWIRPPAFSIFTASRAARTASAGCVIDTCDKARRRPEVSTTPRSERPTHSAVRAPMRPVLRAALISDSPIRAGAPMPTVA